MIQRLSQEKKHNDDWYYQIDQVEQLLKVNGMNPNNLDATERNLLDKLYDAYNKKVKHNKTKKWVKNYALTVLSVIFAVCAVVFVFLASRTFAILALCAGAAAIVAAIISLFLNGFDETVDVVGWISIIVSGIFVIVALIQWLSVFGVSDFVIKDGVLKGYYGNEQVVEVPDGIVEIKDSAFWGWWRSNDNVERVILPEGVKTIGNGAFEYCPSLSEINIPMSVKTISASAFEQCAFEEIHISDGVIFIGAEAFAGCSYLREIYIGSGVKEIHSRAFQKCKNLETIYYNGTEEEWNKIDKADGSAWFEGAWDENTGDYTIVFLK